MQSISADRGVRLCLDRRPGFLPQESTAGGYRAAEQQRVAASQAASRAAVCVFAPNGEGGGSGVVITREGLALTNYHVVQPCGYYMRCGMSDGMLYDAVLVGLDPTGDVALIKLFGRNDFPTATLGDSDQVRPGQACFAVGNPFLLATDLQPTVTWGVISAAHRYQYPDNSILEYSDCIQTDAAINPGNSGGPLFNLAGELIGINGRCSFEKRGRVNVGVGYAISINQIKRFFDPLSAGLLVDHASLGATVSTSEGGEVSVDNILETAPASRRGLQVGDQILSFAGRDILTTNQFKNVLGTFPAGWPVRLSYRHQSDVREVEVRLQNLHSAAELAEWTNFENEPIEPSPHEGKPVEKTGDDVDIPPTIREHFESRDGFANYYFNRKRVEEVWPHGYFSESTSAEAAWVMTASTGDGVPVQLVIGNDRSGLAWGDDQVAVDFAGEEVFDPRELAQRKGIVLALHLVRRLIELGPEHFGDLFYAGAIPWPGAGDAIHPMLRGRYNIAEADFFLGPDDRRLIGVELRFDAEFDPWHVEFDGGFPRTFANLRPFDMRLWRNSGSIQTIKVTRIEAK